MDIIRLAPEKRKEAARVFARAFFDYPMMTFYYPDPKRRTRWLAWYLGCAVTYGLRYGQVYTTPDLAGISIWLPPGQTELTAWRYIRTGFLPAPLIMGLHHYNTRVILNEDLVLKSHKELMPGPHWYLWALAVDPDRRGKGLGKDLLKPGLEQADLQKMPCYLETHDAKNLPFYTRFGFDMLREEQVPGTDLHFWCFIRNPK